MKKRYVIVPIVMLAMLVAFSVPAMAQGCLDNIKTRNCAVTNSGFTNGTITDGTVRAMDTGAPNCEQNWTIVLPPGEVVVAYVHWHRWGECPSHNPTAEFWNADGYYQSISISDTLCPSGNNETRGVWWSGYSPDNGTHHYYWRVNATPGVNIFKATGCYDTEGEHCDHRWFVAVINNTDENNRTHSGVWWHNFGLVKSGQYHPNPYTTQFYNATIGPVSLHNYTLWVAQSHYDSSDINISINNHELDHVIHGSGGYPYSLEPYNVPSTYIETDGSQTVKWYLNPPDTAFYAWFATLAEKMPLGPPDLEVEDIMFPDVMKPNTGYTVKARIVNSGDSGTNGTFNVSLVVDGSPYAKVTGVGPLGGNGGNTTVSFTNVNLAEGCHNFTVIVDCDNDVNESDETKNARTEWYQVDNVIVVQSNSQLMSHPDFKNRNGTYYLENKTITNCVGSGITIKNTNLPIVIQNCTVRDCNWKSANPGWNQYRAGIYLYNVSNVTIKGNRIENNTNAGIRVQNSTHVDIMDNYIANNTLYGIYIYPENLVKPPYPEYVKYINVTNNTVTENQEGIDVTQAFNCTVNCNDVKNNTKYGIYVCGNYSEIYHNRLINNSKYGMNLFNASHNYIYWNDFIDNNKTNSEYPNHQAYDMWKHLPGLNPQNHWNTSWTVSYTYSETSYTNYTGNYWDNDTCADANGDGICDNAYKIDGANAANDYYPMKMQWRWWLCGDADRSTIVDGGDYGELRDYVSDPIHNSVASKWASDVDCSCLVDGGDYGELRDYVSDPVHNSVNCCTGCKCGWLQ